MSLEPSPKRANLTKEGTRPAGTTRIAGVRKALYDMDFDPIKEAVERYRHPMTPNGSRDFCLALIMDRVLPKLKAVEVTSAAAKHLNQVLINIVSGNGDVTVTEANVEQAIPASIEQRVIDEFEYEDDVAEMAEIDPELYS